MIHGEQWIADYRVEQVTNGCEAARKKGGEGETWFVMLVTRREG